MASVSEAVDVDVDVGRRNSPDAEVDVVDGIAGLRSRMYLDQRQRRGEGAWASGAVVPRQAWVTCCGCWYDSDCDEERLKKAFY